MNGADRPALKATLSRRSENVVQVVANHTKLRTEGEQKGEKPLAAFCHNLLLFSGLRRLRQDLVNFISRLEGRRSIQLSYGRTACIDSKSFVGRKNAIFRLLPSAREADALFSWVTGGQYNLHCHRAFTVTSSNTSFQLFSALGATSRLPCPNRRSWNLVSRIRQALLQESRTSYFARSTTDLP